MSIQKNPPGRVRDAILQVLAQSTTPMSMPTIKDAVEQIIGVTPQSSIRSYLRLNTPKLFVREARGIYKVRGGSQSALQQKLTALDDEQAHETFRFQKSTLHHTDCFSWLQSQRKNSIHAVVTDPPYGLHEYAEDQQTKLRNGNGGVWRIPPSFDGHRRSPLPRFTTLTKDQLQELSIFFRGWGRLLIPCLVPGANVIVASNPLVSHLVSNALSEAGLERRGEIIRLTMTMRGGDRPKSAHEEFSDVSVMPRSMWEPWLVYRKPIEGRVQDNLRKWKTGGFRRPAKDKPFGDVIQSSPTRKSERKLAAHPSLKPQLFLRQLVRAALPLGKGIILDPFAGAGSTLAACNAIGSRSVGVEKDSHYYQIAVNAIPRLTEYSGNGTARPYTPNSV
ncbi:MAG: site-specific DNA-methyltransferase [Proteobacteria bacterium]|nr:site-specific DNA-methyltransferase [Pseudomonadota bacterium]